MINQNLKQDLLTILKPLLRAPTLESNGEAVCVTGPLNIKTATIRAKHWRNVERSLRQIERLCEDNTIDEQEISQIITTAITDSLINNETKECTKRFPDYLPSQISVGSQTVRPWELWLQNQTNRFQAHKTLYDTFSAASGYYLPEIERAFKNYDMNTLLELPRTPGMTLFSQKSPQCSPREGHKVKEHNGFYMRKEVRPC